MRSRWGLQADPRLSLFQRAATIRKGREHPLELGPPRSGQAALPVLYAGAVMSALSAASVGRRSVRWAVRVGLFFALLVGGISMLGLERRFIYWPSRELGATPAARGLLADDLWITTPDGERIHGYHLRSDQPASVSRPTLLISHGNAGTIADRLPRAGLFLRQLNVDVVLYDYRGYGQSSGAPHEEGTYTDARAVYDALISAGVSAEHIVLFGESLGCAVSIQLALDRRVRGVILEAPFLSVRAMAKRVFPWLPVGPLLRTRYDNLAKIARITSPLFIVHGSDDDVIPQAHGQGLFAAAREPKRFLSIAGAHHNDVLQIGGADYLAALNEFLRSLSLR